MVAGEYQVAGGKDGGVPVHQGAADRDRHLLAGLQHLVVRLERDGL